MANKSRALALRPHSHRHVNPCARRRPADEPYEIWRDESSGFEWRVLKKYQPPDAEKANPGARWFCLTISPFKPEGELGDVYVRDIKSGVRIK